MDTVDYSNPNGDTDETLADITPETTVETTDYSTFGQETAEPAATPSANAAWDEILNALPDEATRAMVRPGLANWDKGVTQRFEKIHEDYASLKQFQGIDPQQLQAGYNLTQQINDNPVEFMERMRDTLIQQGMYQEANQVQGALDEAEEEDDIDPRIAQMQQQQEQFFQSIQEQQQEQLRADHARKMDVALDNEVSALENKYGVMSDEFKQELFGRTIMMGQQQGRAIPIEEAFNSLQQFMNFARTSPGQKAPRVLPTGGGLPANQQKPVGEMTERERKAAAVEIVRQMQEG